MNTYNQPHGLPAVLWSTVKTIILTAWQGIETSAVWLSRRETFGYTLHHHQSSMRWAIISVTWDETTSYLTCRGSRPLHHFCIHSCPPPSPFLMSSYLLDSLGPWHTRQTHIILGLPSQDVKLLPVDLHLKGVAFHHGYGWLCWALGFWRCGGLFLALCRLPHCWLLVWVRRGSAHTRHPVARSREANRPAKMALTSRASLRPDCGSPGRARLASEIPREPVGWSARCKRSSAVTALPQPACPSSTTHRQGDTLARLSPKYRDIRRNGRSRMRPNEVTHYVSRRAERDVRLGEGELCSAMPSGSCSSKVVGRGQRRGGAGWGGRSSDDRGGRALPAPCLRPRGGGRPVPERAAGDGEEASAALRSRGAGWAAAWRRGGGGAGGGGEGGSRGGLHSGCPEGKEPPTMEIENIVANTVLLKAREGERERRGRRRRRARRGLRRDVRGEEEGLRWGEEGPAGRGSDGGGERGWGRREGGGEAAGGGDPRGVGREPASHRAALGHLHRAAGAERRPWNEPFPETNRFLRPSGSCLRAGFRRMCSHRSSVALGLLIGVNVRKSGLGLLWKSLILYLVEVLRGERCLCFALM